MQTDDWGFIERTFHRTYVIGTTNQWEDYSIFYEIIVTGVITGLYWGFSGYFLIKLYYGESCCARFLSLIISLVGLIPILAGNAVIYIRIFLFKRDLHDLLDEFNSKDFISNYTRSVNYYSYAMLGMVALSTLHIIGSILYCLRKEPETPIAPIKEPEKTPVEPIVLEYDKSSQRKLQDYTINNENKENPEENLSNKEHVTKGPEIISLRK